MKNSERYYLNVKWFREELQKIGDAYELALQQHAQFKGSAGYDQLVEKFDAERKAQVANLRHEHDPKFREILNNMREAEQARKLTPPTQDQLAILQALKMRSNVSNEELEQAARSLDGCPLALSVLDDIAAAREVGRRGLRRFNTGPASADIKAHIDALERSVNALMRLERVNHRQDYTKVGGDMTLYAVDRDPQSVEDCINRFGGFLLADDAAGLTEAIGDFCSAVDAKP